MIDLLTSSMPAQQRTQACQRLLLHAARQNLVNMVAPLIDQFALDPLAMDEVGTTFIELAFENRASTRELIMQAVNSYKPADAQRKTFLEQVLGYAMNHGRANDPSGMYDALCIDLIRVGAMPDLYCNRAFEEKRFDKIVRAAAALNDTDKMTVLNDYLVQAVYANQTAKGNYQHKHRRQLIEALIRAGANPLHDQFIQAACTNTNSIGLIISASKAASHQHSLDDRVKDAALRFLLEHRVKLTPTQLRNQTAQLIKNDASLTRTIAGHLNGVDHLIANGTFETVLDRIKQTNVELPTLVLEEEGLRGAARAGNVGLAALLLQQQTNPLLEDSLAKNYFAYAVGHTDLKTGYQLIEAALQARPQERNDLLSVALWACPNFGVPALVTRLINAGADIGSVTPRGDSFRSAVLQYEPTTAMHYVNAALDAFGPSGRQQVLAVFLKSSLFFGMPDFFKHLFSAGADPYHRDQQDKDFFDHLVEEKRTGGIYDYLQSASDDQAAHRLAGVLRRVALAQDANLLQTVIDIAYQNPQRYPLDFLDDLDQTGASAIEYLAKSGDERLVQLALGINSGIPTKAALCYFYQCNGQVDMAHTLHESVRNDQTEYNAILDAQKQLHDKKSAEAKLMNIINRLDYAPMDPKQEESLALESIFDFSKTEFVNAATVAHYVARFVSFAIECDNLIFAKTMLTTFEGSGGEHIEINGKTAFQRAQLREDGTDRYLFPKRVRVETSTSDQPDGDSKPAAKDVAMVEGM